MFLLQEQFMNISHRVYGHGMSPTTMAAATGIDVACCEEVKFMLDSFILCLFMIMCKL